MSIQILRMPKATINKEPQNPPEINLSLYPLIQRLYHHLPSIRTAQFAINEAIFFTFCPVFLARISFMIFFSLRISFACISMSVACPLVPPSGWCIMILECGRAYLLPLAPQLSKNAPIDAACPTHIVQISGFI